MFEAWIMVCLMGAPNACFEASDTRGPYVTEQRCIERSIEMAKDIDTLPGHKAVAFKCKQLKGKLAI
jgi:hypothetical protein